MPNHINRDKASELDVVIKFQSTLQPLTKLSNVFSSYIARKLAVVFGKLIDHLKRYKNSSILVITLRFIPNLQSSAVEHISV